ncbi:MAG: hypothetical protein V4724_16315 [Pseudomonadota bacterium]
MKHSIFQIALILSLWSGISSAQPPIGTDAPANLFTEKALVAPHIHVENLSQFLKWSGKPIPQGDYSPEYFEKTRLGTITFSSDLRVHIDVIRDTVHFPSYFELVDSHSGIVLGKYPVFDPQDAEWYFSGNGTAYLNQKHLSLCGPRYTRKIVQKGKGLAEVTQGLVYVGAETDVESATQLYESPTSRTVVATVVPGTKVTVLGLVPGKSEFFEMAFLVKTPFGLTGWHVPRDKLGDGRISIYQCN